MGHSRTGKKYLTHTHLNSDQIQIPPTDKKVHIPSPVGSNTQQVPNTRACSARPVEERLTVT
jgi:hypothetical protein